MKKMWQTYIDEVGRNAIEMDRFAAEKNNANPATTATPTTATNNNSGSTDDHPTTTTTDQT